MRTIADNIAKLVAQSRQVQVVKYKVAGSLEEAMALRVLPGAAIAALVGAAMLAASSGPSGAFTLDSPSLERPVATAGVEPVYWRHWGGWHGGWHRWGGWHGGWHRWGWGPGWGWGPRWGRWGPAYGFGPVWRCWWTPWGFRRCGWA